MTLSIMTFNIMPLSNATQHNVTNALWHSA
jgi:hypothetical protein